MEKIRKNIEDERVKSMLMGFGMGLGFGISLCGGIGTTKKHAAMGCTLGMIVEDTFSAVQGDISKDIKSESDYIKDIITSDSPINIDTHDDFVGMAHSSHVKPDINYTNSECAEPQIQSAPKKETPEDTEHLLTSESHSEEEIRHKELECVNCFRTFQSKKTLNIHHRNMVDCRILICKEPHSHEYKLRKFSSLEEATSYCATLGQFKKNCLRRASGDIAPCGYCRNRKRFDCKASWSLKKNGLGYFAFTGCLKHVDSCLGMDEKRLKPGRKLGSGRKNRIPRKYQEKKFKCDKCDYKTAVSNSLKIHIKSVHDKIKDHVCQECGYSCSLKPLLDSHIKQVHLKMKNYMCEECGYSSFTNGTLQLHKQSVHENMKSHVCEQCGKAFSSKSRLNTHKKVVHLKIKKHVCQYCGYATALSGNLKKHKATVHKMQN